MTNNKPRIVKDYDKLPEEIVARVKLNYPDGFVNHLIRYTNKEGKFVSALPFETEDVYYLIRMTELEARQIIEDDEDYDEDGILRDDFAADEFGDEDEDILNHPEYEEDNQEEEY